MKLLSNKRPDPIPRYRIQFGMKPPICSMTFTNTTIDELYQLAIKVFSDVIIESEVRMINHSPLNAPEKSTGIALFVRKEVGSKNLPGSRTKTLYGVTSKEAYDIFKNNYEKYVIKNEEKK